MNNETILGGKAELAIGNVLIPAELLGDMSPNFAEGVRETSSLAGTRRKPSGTFDTSELTGTMLLPSMDSLKALFPEDYTPGTGTQTTGNVVWGTNSCATKVPKPINIHYVCDDTDDNDIHIFAGLVSMQFNPTYNESDGLAVAFTIYADTSANGVVRFGTGDLDTPSVYDVATQTTVAAV